MLDVAHQLATSAKLGQGAVMKAIELTGAPGLENLKLVDRPLPEPGPGQVRLRVLAASLNYRDLLMVTGKYDPRMKLPLVPVSDAVGIVDAIGDGAQVQLGARVCPLITQHWLAGDPSRSVLRRSLGGPLDGALQEQMIVEAQSLVAAPSCLSDEEAACLPCAWLTAWSALVELGHLKAGERVLVQGTGGVSLAALAIARLHGARVVITSKSQEKLRRAERLGAELGISYVEQPMWGDQAKEWAGGLGVDHVVEVAGGQTLEQSLRAVRVGGTISIIGVLSGVKASLSLLPILMRQVRLQGVFAGHKQALEAMCRAVEASNARPQVDRVFPLDEARQALEHLASAEHFGKICVRVASS